MMKPVFDSDYQDDRFEVVLINMVRITAEEIKPSRFHNGRKELRICA
jgi:hypothetical protein